MANVLPLSSHPTWFLTLSNFSFPAAYDHPPYSGMCCCRAGMAEPVEIHARGPVPGVELEPVGAGLLYAFSGLKPKPAQHIAYAEAHLTLRGQDVINRGTTLAGIWEILPQPEGGRRLSPLPAIP